jgi:hypothetical protein
VTRLLRTNFSLSRTRSDGPFHARTVDHSRALPVPAAAATTASAASVEKPRLCTGATGQTGAVTELKIGYAPVEVHALYGS